jgi:hypothetical protein
LFLIPRLRCAATPYHATQRLRMRDGPSLRLGSKESWLLSQRLERGRQNSRRPVSPSRWSGHAHTRHHRSPLGLNQRPVNLGGSRSRLPADFCRATSASTGLPRPRSWGARAAGAGHRHIPARKKVGAADVLLVGGGSAETQTRRCVWRHPQISAQIELAGHSKCHGCCGRRVDKE